MWLKQQHTSHDITNVNLVSNILCLHSLVSPSFISKNVTLNVIGSRKSADMDTNATTTAEALFYTFAISKSISYHPPTFSRCYDMFIAVFQ